MICGMGARSYGQFFASLVSELDKQGTENASTATVSYLEQQTAYATIWPGDQEILDKFVSEPLYKLVSAGRLNLILQGIEGDLRTDMSETQKVSRHLNIEHVMPQEWEKNWPLPPNKQDDPTEAEQRNRIIHTIGNLTLVSQRLNANLSNQPWEEKKGTLSKHTVLFLNKKPPRQRPTSMGRGGHRGKEQKNIPARNQSLASRQFHTLTPTQRTTSPRLKTLGRRLPLHPGSHTSPEPRKRGGPPGHSSHPSAAATTALEIAQLVRHS